MYNGIVERAISGKKSDAEDAFEHLLHSCAMTREIAEYIREHAKLRVISNRAAKFVKGPTRVVEYSVYTAIVVALIILTMFGVMHVYTDVQSRKSSQQSERP